MREIPFLKLIERIETATGLDPTVHKVKGVVDTVIGPQWLRDALHGVWVGHALHPIAVQVPIGAWMSAAILDLMPHTNRASRALVGVGTVAAIPTAVSGYVDWSRLHHRQQRVGIVHSGANLVATGLYAASFLQRTRGHHGSGKVLSFSGLAVASAAAFLGGHLSYRQAAGVNHAADVVDLFPAGWHGIGSLDDLAEGKMVRRTVGEMPLIVYRRGEHVMVLTDTCSHLSGPLSDGTLVAGDEPCVECPWHGSRFSLISGDVVRGPATANQPRFDTRVVAGTVEVHLPEG